MFRERDEPIEGQTDQKHEKYAAEMAKLYCSLQDGDVNVVGLDTRKSRKTIEARADETSTRN